MAKNLHALIKVQKWEVDEKRRILGEMMRHEDAVIAEIKRMEEELKNEQEIAASSPMAGITFEIYVHRYLERREEAENALADIRSRIRQLQDKITEEFQKLKTYEIVQQNRDKREAEELNRKEQNELDEIGMNLHRRRKEDDYSSSEEE